MKLSLNEGASLNGGAPSDGDPVLETHHPSSISQGSYVDCYSSRTSFISHPSSSNSKRLTRLAFSLFSLSVKWLRRPTKSKSALSSSALWLNVSRYSSPSVPFGAWPLTMCTGILGLPQALPLPSQPSHFAFGSITTRSSMPVRTMPFPQCRRKSQVGNVAHPEI
jgi:hypothetical protein